MVHKIAYAKFDLAIHIKPKKTADGYFPVHYIDCQIDLCDKLTFENQIEKIEVICDEPTLPVDEDNFVYKTAILLKKIVDNKQSFSSNKRLGAKITLLKGIPIKAGFGGGSSDAAATLLGLCRLWQIRLDDNQIKSLTRELGKDFYYSLHGRLSEVVGKGKNYQVTALSSRLPELWLLIVVPLSEKPSTSWVYEHLDTKNIGRNFDKIEKLKMAILKNDKMGILKNLTNDFEDSVLPNFPIVGKMKDDLAQVGAQASIMAGSGLAVVGFFDSLKKAEEGKNKLKSRRGLKQIFVARPIN